MRIAVTVDSEDYSWVLYFFGLFVAYTTVIYFPAY